MRFIASEPYLKEIFTDLSEGESQALKVQELGWYTDYFVY